MTTFKDIIGYKKEKEELMYICDMIKNSKKYIDKGVYIPRALLLYGDPGTGKTTMSKALINESGRKCFSCKKNKSNGDFVDEIRNTFEEAKKNSPSIIFLDDMDKFAEDNLNMNSNKEEFATIQTCMEDLDNSDVFVIATANDIEFIPKSLLRTGRFGRKMYIKNPNSDSVQKIIDNFLLENNIKCDIDSDSLVKILNHTSCATIKEILNEARIYSLYENKEKVSREDMIRAILKNLIGDIEKPKNEKNKLYRATHEAGHAIVALINGCDVPLVTVASHGDYGGITYISDKDDVIDGLKQLKIELQITLAGKAATELDSLNMVDFGAEVDLDRAAEKASYAIRRDLAYGFNYGYDKRSYDHKQAYSRLDTITTKTYEVLEESYKEAKQLLITHRELLEKIVSELLEHETLLYNDVRNIYLDYVKVHPTLFDKIEQFK